MTLGANAVSGGFGGTQARVRQAMRASFGNDGLFLESPRREGSISTDLTTRSSGRSKKRPSPGGVRKLVRDFSLLEISGGQARVCSGHRRPDSISCCCGTNAQIMMP